MRDSASEVADISDAVHLCIDMQNILSLRAASWATPWMARVLPTIASIVSRHRLNDLHANSSRRRIRKIVPDSGRAIFVIGARRPAGHLPRIRSRTRAGSEPVRSARCCHRQAGLFGVQQSWPREPADREERRNGRDHRGRDRRLRALDGPERRRSGFRVVIVEDALCSSSDVGHDALMTMYRTRFHGEVDLKTAEELAEFWRE